MTLLATNSLYSRSEHFAIIGNFVTNVRSVDEALLFEGETQSLTLPPDCFVCVVEDFAKRFYSRLIHVFDDACTISCWKGVEPSLKIEFPLNAFSVAFTDASGLDQLVEAEEQWTASVVASRRERLVGKQLVYS